jgi:hypothetical protein
MDCVVQKSQEQRACKHEAAAAGRVTLHLSKPRGRCIT